MTRKHQVRLTRFLNQKYFVWSRDALILIIIFIGVSTWQARNMLKTDGSEQVNQQNLVSLQGEVVPLLAPDKINLIYFFAPWCQICALSIGNLEYLDPNKVNVVVVALDFSAKEDVQLFVEKHDVKATVLLGHEALKQQFSIQGYPSYYLVDRNNVIVSSSYGYSSAVGLKLREAFGV